MVIISTGSGCLLSLGCLVGLFLFLTPLFCLLRNILIDIFLIQHYDRRGQYDIALSKINEAIEHTPTVIDLYSAKVCFCFQLLVHPSNFLVLI